MEDGGCDVEAPQRKLWFDSLEKPNIFSLMATKLACKSDVGGRSRGCVQVAPADFCGMSGIEVDCSWLKLGTRGGHLTSQLSCPAA